MNKELQNKAWSVLPKEFKEEVKKEYRKCLNEPWCVSSYLRGRLRILRELFGEHNLTSDAEGEEMLTVTRNKVQELYKKFRKDGSNACLYAAATLDALFGTKCLPDEKSTTQFKIGDKVRAKGTKQIGTIKEPYSNDIGYRVYFEDGDGGWDKEYQEDELIPYKEPKPAEPKFKVGDKVRVITHQGEATPLEGEICEIIDIDKYDPICTYYLHNFSGEWYSDSDLEPYTEPEKESRNLSKNIVNCDKQLDNILKDSIRNERRLNIAVQVLCAIIPKYKDNFDGIGLSVQAEKDMIKDAFRIADALLAECEKGGSK